MQVYVRMGFKLSLMRAVLLEPSTGCNSYYWKRLSLDELSTTPITGFDILVEVPAPKDPNIFEFVFTDDAVESTVMLYRPSSDNQKLELASFCSRHHIDSHLQLSIFGEEVQTVAVEAGGELDLLLAIAGFTPVKGVVTAPSRRLHDLIPEELHQFAIRAGVTIRHSK